MRSSCALIVFSAFAPPVYAQVPSSDLNAIIRQQEQIQRQQEEQRREQERRAREGAERQTTIPFELPSPPPEGEQGGCVDVLHIEVEGTVHLSQDEVDEIVRPFVGRCLALSDLNDLMRAISQAYVDKGYVAARPYLPQQDMRGGTLRLVVVEGKVEDIPPDSSESAHSLEMLFAFPGVIDRPLNLRDIEQGLDQINRLRSNNATMSLEPGSTQGGTRVVVKNEPRKRWRLSGGINNSGQESTGRNKWQATGEVDDLLGVNDFLSLTTDRSAVHDGNWRASRSVNGFFSVPFGYWTLSLSASYSDYSSPVFGTVQTYHSTGNTKTRKVELERVVQRDADSKTSVKGLFRTYTANAYFNDQKLDTSSYSLSVAGLGFSHSRRLLGGLLSFGGTWEHGLDMVHAKADEAGLPKDSPHAQFDKASADISYLRPFQLGGLSLTYTGAVHGQWSEDTLYSPERISLGGQYSVRGFDAEYISGDTGAYVRNELALTLPETGEGWIDLGLGRVTPFVALDYGALRGDPKDDYERGAMAGWAAGLRTSGGMVMLSATYSQPLNAPAFIRERDHEAYLSLTVEY
ncbi:ShlB/FhaC/HecB family hemolysin secretion/activation protein [Magnetospirillum aberrantis]|uniref:ShlB/FhaC/HecB family hemolysin secretion/activation protein n=1 Tax=Magnetospirillum aberrantis SpK TaxID=908842 RepID=A0A7C9USR7_9PROT|nr:ShlB/FhaC/HecB family hemolysin secretion/activation protein [Magnetospirillum aberrantis]NFV79467.1 ShlB/FhaC/HecB family hemolysin secretion/activation protein [Magnetospirillum aberrantis SpK]